MDQISQLEDPKWQGAEARVSEITCFGNKAILKQRFRKTYRHPVLDQKLISRRIIQEVRCLVKAHKSGVSTPLVYYTDPDEGMIVMEFIEGMTAKEAINNGAIQRNEVATKIGALLAKAHACDIIHGDLTTSNILFRRMDDSTFDAVLIDFGLAQVSSMTEDKAVDLYVLERALSSTHPESKKLFDLIVESYAENLDKSSAKSILDKLAEVQMRGRKRSMVG